MMNMDLYVRWRLYAAKTNARNMRIISFVMSGLLVKYNDNPVTSCLGHVHKW